MAVNILAHLGFNFKKSSTTAVVNNITNVKTSVSSLNAVFSNVEQRIDSLNKVAKWAAAGTAVKDFFSGVKSAADATVSVFKKQFDFVSSFAASGDKIAKTSRLVGLSVKDYQAFSSAAQHAGMSTEEMDVALRKFNVNLGKARSGDKNSLKMFDSILGGKSISSFKDSTSLISAIADGYQKLGSAEQKAFLSQELFGRSGLKMSELLSQGDEGIKKLIADFESHGGGFSEEGAKNAEAFDDALQDMLETVNSLKISVAEELFPTFTELFKTIQSYIKDNKEKLIPVIKSIFTSTAGFVKNILPKIPIILDKILSVVDLIGPGVLSVSAAFFTILPILTQIFMAVKVIVLAFGAPLLASIGGVLVLLYEMYSIGKRFYDNWEMFSDFIRNDLSESFGVIGKFLSWVGDTIANDFFRLYKIITNFNFDDFVGSVVMVFKELGGMIYDSIFGNIRAAFGAAKYLLKKIPGIGRLLGDDEESLTKTVFSASAASGSSSSSLGASVAQAVSESHTTTTSRFAVDFKNMPRGVQVTAPDHGDFDYSRGYVLGGA